MPEALPSASGGQNALLEAPWEILMFYMGSAWGQEPESDISVHSQGC